MSTSTDPQALRGIVRQGDVLLLPVAELPAHRAERVASGPRIVLAEGEATGHAHVVLGSAYLVRSTGTPSTSEAGLTHLVVSEPASLVHDEHEAIGLLPGVYQVRRQREYVPPAPSRPQRFRRVAD